MVLQCYSWIIHLIKQIIGDYDDDDDVATDDILTRFSMQVAFQCQKASKKLQLLTSSSQSGLHQRRERPLILRCCCDTYPRLYVIEEKSEKECKVVRGLKALEYASFVGCCNELVLFRTYIPLFHYVVFNPLSKGRITTIYPPTWKGREVYCGLACGFFFHPLEKEYRILCVAEVSKTLYEYHLYQFGAKIWRRTATTYFNYQPLRAWRSPEMVNDKPSIVNGRLHWYTGIIMIFDVVTEEFSVRPIPVDESYLEMRYVLPDLLVEEDQLCLCCVGGYEQVMDIWILEDYDKWSWARKYIVNLSWDINRYPIKTNGSSSHFVKVVSIHKDELVLFWRYRGMFCYHLVSHDIEKINLKKSEIDNYDGYSYDTYLNFAVYNAIASD